MQCPHCRKEIHPEQKDIQFNYSANNPIHHPTKLPNRRLGLKVQSNKCPSCQCISVSLHFFALDNLAQGAIEFVYPRVGPMGPPPIEVPKILAADFSEANEVLPISPKASAALSRRCLQKILAEAGYTSENLAKQVDGAISEKNSDRSLPPDLRDSLDAIRNFGNFSAHPINDVTTQQVIDVEPGEAEWCLELVEQLFQHYYVRPARAAERRRLLDAKLAAAGKPAMKKVRSEEN